MEKVKIKIGLAEPTYIPLDFDGEKFSTVIFIDDIPYHFERINKENFQRDYVVDTDPQYDPKPTKNGDCYILAPFSE